MATLTPAEFKELASRSSVADLEWMREALRKDGFIVVLDGHEDELDLLGADDWDPEWDLYIDPNYDKPTFWQKVKGAIL